MFGNSFFYFVIEYSLVSLITRNTFPPAVLQQNIITVSQKIFRKMLHVLTENPFTKRIPN